MIQKLLLENFGGDFVIEFDGADYDIPKGKFDCGVELGYFIISTSKKWGKKVEKIEEASNVKIEKKEDVKKEEVKVETEKKTSTPKETSKTKK